MNEACLDMEIARQGLAIEQALLAAQVPVRFKSPASGVNSHATANTGTWSGSARPRARENRRTHRLARWLSVSPQFRRLD